MKEWESRELLKAARDDRRKLLTALDDIMRKYHESHGHPLDVLHQEILAAELVIKDVRNDMEGE